MGNISCCHDNVRLNNDSKSWRRTLNACRVILNRVDVCGGQSAWDDKIPYTVHCGQSARTINVLRHNACTRLHSIRGPGLSPIGRNMIGLASCYRSIIVKYPTLSVYILIANMNYNCKLRK